MGEDEGDNMSSDTRLSDLLVHWEELRDRGQAVSAEELCRDCPELLATLRQQIQVLQAMDAVLKEKELRQATASRRHLDQPGARSTTSPVQTVTQTAEERRDKPSVAGYEILRELGRGGMGVVYQARQVSLDRVVALKMILPGAYAAPSDLARFRTEVEAIARLEHPNLVRVYEVGEQDGRPYFTMEFVDGRDLHRQIGSRPQPPRQAAELVETLARAMHLAHQQGIVHRDLKPANVLLTREGVPKVSDFGLAKRLDSAVGPTLSGAILGTPGYMAPEQAAGRGKEIGPTTDTYGLGAILYEMLTGRPPFQAATSWDTIRQVQDAEPVSPRRLQPTVARDLETICLKCLQKEPSKRYASAAALADDLRRFLAGEPIQARPVSLVEQAVKWAKRQPAAAALVAVSCLAVLVLVVGAGVYQTRLRWEKQKAEDEAEASRQHLVRLLVAQGTHLLDEGDSIGALIWFVEALRLDEGDPARAQMHRLRIAAVLRQCPCVVQLWFHAGPVLQACFSPDGRYVLTTSADKTARLWDVHTGEPVGRPLQHNDAVRGGSFREDGRAVVTASADGTAKVWDVSTGEALTDPLRHGAPVHSAAFSPDGRYVLTASGDKTAQVWDVATGKRLTTLRHGATVRHAAFSPDGRLIVTASDDHTARVWNAGTGEPLGKPLKHRAPVTQASFSPDGKRILTASLDHRACIWDADTGEQVTAPLEQGSGINAAAFSKDGSLVATAGDDNAARVWDANTGAPLTPLLKSNGSLRSAAFSPTDRLVVTAGNDHVARVWQIPGERGVDVHKNPLAKPIDPGRPTRWLSPDGRWVVVSDGSSAQVQDAGTGQPLGAPLQHGSRVLDVAFSPDGGRLVTASDDNTARIWDRATGELLSQPLRHSGTVRCAAFSPDGRLVVTASADQTARVWDASTGEPITPPLAFKEPPVRAAFTHGDSRVSVTGADRTVWTWTLDRDDRPVANLRDVAQLLAGGRVAGGGLVPLDPAALRSALLRLRSEYPDEFAVVPRRGE
jgi:WD40 repeat protein